MFRPKGAMFVSLVVVLVIVVPFVSAQETKQSPAESGQAEREAMYYRYLEFSSYVKGGSIEPHWMADGSSFWYAEGAPANTVIWKVDPKTNTKTPLFDTARLRKALTPLLGHEPPYQGLPFEDFSFVDGEKAVKFTVENKEFILQLDTYALTLAPVLSEQEKNRLPQIVHHPLGDLPEVASPDGHWFASVKEHDIWLRSGSDGHSVQLTTGGIEDYEWGHDVWNIWLKWSPDSSRLVVARADLRKFPKIPIVHYLGQREKLEWVPDWNPRADELIPETELFIVDIRSHEQIRIETGEEPAEWLYPYPGWRPDGAEFFFYMMSPDYKKLELRAASPQTGKTRVVLAETTNTFLIGVEEGLLEILFTWLPDGKRFIWMSERDGWRHLYLYDLDGKLIRRLTQGSFPVVEVVAVDDEAGWVYFTAHGEQQRPYDTHLYRVNLEGQGFTRLTEADGQHRIQFAPSKEFYLDTHSSIDRPRVVELRRKDGELIQTISKANTDALADLKWSPLEEFVVKAADGKTDLWGLLYKPYNFNPMRKYPVIERIYAHAKASVVPKYFTARWIEAIQLQALAQLGFITFVVDARGTPERGKAFQDVVYGNAGRNEIPDHVAALRQLAEKRPYMDLKRVGIYGASAGGYFTVRAMLLAPDVYQVGVAAAGGSDHATWKFYMGLPENNKEGYEYASNLRFVENLKGKLFLMHGTSDKVAPLSETMKLADALIRAGKRFDLLVMPDQDHVESIRSP